MGAPLFSTVCIQLLLGLGWIVHVVAWSYALAKVRGGAADRDEWLREAFIRVAMIGLLLYAIWTPGRGHVKLPDGLAAAVALIFWSAQLLAVKARLDLGGAWGIGTRSRGGLLVTGGTYRVVSHPIYVGTFTALLMQALLIQNLTSLVLVAGAATVIVWKVIRENRWLRTRRER